MAQPDQARRRDPAGCCIIPDGCCIVATYPEIGGMMYMMYCLSPLPIP